MSDRPGPSRFIPPLRCETGESCYQRQRCDAGRCGAFSDQQLQQQERWNMPPLISPAELRGLAIAALRPLADRAGVSWALYELAPEAKRPDLKG